MPQPITHYQVVKQAMETAAPQLWTAYSNYAGFGSFGPDLYYIKDLALRYVDQHLDYDKLADTMHAEKSMDFFCSMLGIVKQNWNVDYETAGKQLAYAIGYYAHVITDCLFHPYVYRKSNDHWKYHDPKEFENVHKKVEAIIDHHIMQANGITDQNLSYFNVNCDSCGNDDLLDPAIANLLSQSLNSIYAETIGANFNTYSLDMPLHPLNEAYDDYKNAFTFVYGLQNVLFQFRSHFSNNRLAQKLTAEDINQANELHGPWLTTGESAQLTYSVMDLLSFSIKAVQQVITATYGFLASDDPDAKNYFANTNTVVFLDQNWNLDTGLPDSLNTTEQNFALDETRFDFGINTLSSNFERLKI